MLGVVEKQSMAKQEQVLAAVGQENQPPEVIMRSYHS